MVYAGFVWRCRSTPQIGNSFLLSYLIAESCGEKDLVPHDFNVHK